MSEEPICGDILPDPGGPKLCVLPPHGPWANHHYVDARVAYRHAQRERIQEDAGEAEPRLPHDEACGSMRKGSGSEMEICLLPASHTQNLLMPDHVYTPLHQIPDSQRPQWVKLANAADDLLKRLKKPEEPKSQPVGRRATGEGHDYEREENRTTPTGGSGMDASQLIGAISAMQAELDTRRGEAHALTERIQNDVPSIMALAGHTNMPAHVHTSAGHLQRAVTDMEAIIQAIGAAIEELETWKGQIVQ